MITRTLSSLETRTVLSLVFQPYRSRRRLQMSSAERSKFFSIRAARARRGTHNNIVRPPSTKTYFLIDISTTQ